MNPFDEYDEPAPRAAVTPGSIGGLVVQKKRAPLAPLAEPIAAANLTRTNQQIGEASATLPYAAPKAAADTRTAVANATKAEIEAKRAAIEAGPPVDPALAGAIKGLGLDELLMSVAAARREIGRGTATGVTGAFMRAIPGSTANDLTGSLDSIQGSVIMEKLQALKDASKTGASGMGALSEREGARLAASVAALGPNLSAEKLLEGLATIERHAHALQAVSNGENPENPEVAKKYGILTSQPRKTERVLVNDGTTGGDVDPALKGVNDHAAMMMRAGATEPEVRAYLNSVQPGLGDTATGIADNIKAVQQFPEFKPEVITQMPVRDMGMIESGINGLAQSPVGAGIIGAADMLSGGTLDNLAASPELARAGMAGVADAHPVANFAGQTTGAVAAGLGAEFGAARLGAGKLGAMLAGDALPGVVYGAGSSDDGSRVGGALTGGFAGLAGGLGGRALGRGIGGVKDAGARLLDDMGVRMTLPQMIGGAAKGVEDWASGIPGLRGIIQPMRQRGVEDANRAIMDRAVEGIGGNAGGQIAEAGMNNLGDAVTQGYKDALDGVMVRADSNYASAIAPISQKVAQIPRVGPDLHAAIKQTVEPMFGRGGTLSGEGMQAIDRGLADLKSSYFKSGDPLYATHIAPAIDAVDDAITGIVARQAPDVLPKYTAAKDAYRKVSTVNDAVLAGHNTEGVFTPAQLGTASKNNAKKFGGTMQAGKGNRPFFEEQRAMQRILPSKIGDTGSGGRALIPGALALIGGAGGYASADDGAGAAGAGSGALLGGTGALALASPYLARGAIQKLLMVPRHPSAQLVADVVARSRLPGALALPFLASGQ